MVAKRFFYVCAGLLCLALAHHFGAQSATAQSGQTVAAAFPYSAGVLVLTTNGDTFYRGFGPYAYFGAAVPAGNFWDAPTPATQETWGGVKARYRQGAGAATRDK